LGYYRDLLTERVNTAKQMAAESRKLKADADTEEAQHTLRMGELDIAAKRDHNAVLLATKHKGNEERVASDIALENEEYQLQVTAFNAELAALDSHAKDYENKKKAIQDREEELTRAHEAKITQIKDKAEVERSQRILSAEQHFNDAIAQGLTSTLMRHQSFAAMMGNIGSQIAEGIMQNAIKSILADDMTKEHDAAAAARKAFLAGMHFPFPANLVMAPVLGAAAFASVMAFAEGGLVPGVENFDSVNAKLTPGETVLPKQMTERLSRAAGDSDSSARPIAIHVHHNPTIHALDSESMGRVLQKNAEVLTKHVEHTLRKMNR
jgi:hypothetical protein